jgi:prolipoprotein diacylglyceryltransferase
MLNEAFIMTLAVTLFGCLVWGMRTLPQEHWQIIAAAPRRKSGASWEGVNFTYYGLFSANAYVLAVGLYYVLLRSVGVPVLWTAVTMVLLLGVCIPASRIVARVVEHKAHTFTVGGAVFVGIILAPWIILLTNHFLVRFPEHEANPEAVMAALAIAYALGEGMGRLACLSYGCCYGRPLNSCSPLTRRLFRGMNVVFSGATKKAAYAGGLDGQPLVPVQTLTSLVNTVTALTGLWLFTQERYALACLGVLAITQGWRFLSEFIRADYRGDGRISDYQWMGVAAVLYIGLLFSTVDMAEATARPDIGAGLAALWQPAPILILQLLWGLIFFYMGKSTITRSTISFHVVTERT